MSFPTRKDYMDRDGDVINSKQAYLFRYPDQVGEVIFIPRSRPSKSLSVWYCEAYSLGYKGLHGITIDVARSLEKVVDPEKLSNNLHSFADVVSTISKSKYSNIDLLAKRFNKMTQSRKRSITV